MDDVSFALATGREPRADRRVRIGQDDDRADRAASAPEGGASPRRARSVRRQEHRSYLAIASSGRCAGAQIGFVPQDPGNALNRRPDDRRPGARRAALVLKCTSRAEERSGSSRRSSRSGCRTRRGSTGSYPHELSGGMLQRVLIGLAVMPRPSLIVADEPTSGLDVTIQKRVLDLFERTQELARAQPAVHHPRPGDRRRARRPPGGAQGRRRAGARGVEDRVRGTRVRVHARAPGRRPGDQPRPIPARSTSLATPRSATPSGNQIDVRSVSKTSVGARRRGRRRLVQPCSAARPTRWSASRAPARRRPSVCCSGSSSPTAGEIVIGDAAVNGTLRGRSGARSAGICSSSTRTRSPRWIRRGASARSFANPSTDSGSATRTNVASASPRRFAPSGCPKRCSPASRRNSPAVSASASRSPERWSCVPTCSSSTSRPRRST